MVLCLSNHYSIIITDSFHIINKLLLKPSKNTTASEIIMTAKFDHFVLLIKVIQERPIVLRLDSLSWFVPHLAASAT